MLRRNKADEVLRSKIQCNHYMNVTFLKFIKVKVEVKHQLRKTK